MRTPLQDLWDEAVPWKGPCPAPRPEAVARRVNAALDAVPSERKRYMRQKWRTAAILAAVLLALTGSALAVARSWNVLDAFFGGSSEVGEALMDTTPHSVSDDNYTLTATSSVSDGSAVYLTVTVEGKTPEAVEALMADDFENIDTWSAFFLLNGEVTDKPTVSSLTTEEEKTMGTETSRTWGMELRPAEDVAPEVVSIRLGVMEKGLRLEVPLTPAQAVTVPVNAAGLGTGTLDHAAGGPVFLQSVELTPLGVTVNWTYPVSSGESRPVPAFLGTDGTLYSWSQLVSMYGRERQTSDGEAGLVALAGEYPFRSVQDLARLKAVVFEGIAYPLDGGESYEVDTSGLPGPFQLPLMDELAEGSGYAVPVRALCDALGASCRWDGDSRSVTMTFRGATIVLTEGEKAALVNGETVELSAAPAIQNGQLAAGSEVFDKYWLLDMSAAFEDWSADLTERVAWVVVP